jgi:hypothetical protein
MPVSAAIFSNTGLPSGSSMKRHEHHFKKSYDKHPLLVAVGSSDDVRSSIWRLWVRKNDVYFGTTDSLPAFKVSLHQSDQSEIWRIALVRSLDEGVLVVGCTHPENGKIVEAAGSLKKYQTRGGKDRDRGGRKNLRTKRAPSGSTRPMSTFGIFWTMRWCLCSRRRRSS